jgi:hypothetical protein
MRKQLSMTTAMAAALVALPACSSNDGWSDDVVADRDTAVCVDRQGRRVDDDRCVTGRHGGGVPSAFLWYYIGRNAALPYHGDSIYDRRFARRGAAGSFVPRPGVDYARAPVSTRMTRSRAVSRGGLGSSSRRFGGGRS